MLDAAVSVAPLTGAARFLTVGALSRIMPSCADVEQWVAPLSESCQRFGITTRDRIAMFIASLAHESAELNTLEENLNYSADALRRMWPRRFTWADAHAYGRIDGPGGHKAQPDKIAELAYGMRADLGNTQPGDGAAFVGRGAFQTTGRANYQAVADKFGLRLIEVQHFLLTPYGAALAAGLYWSGRKFNALADAGDFDELSRRLNGARTIAETHGLAKRREYYRAARKLLPV